MTARNSGTADGWTRLRELAAPDWLVRIFRPKPAPIPWEAAGRAAAAVTAPVTLGLVTGHLAAGLVGSVGAVCATNSDRGGAYRLRGFRVGLAVLLGAIGFLLGSLVHGRSLATLAVLTTVAASSALISSIGAIASTAGLQFVLFAAIRSGLDLPLLAWQAPLIFLAGGAWTMLLTLTGLLYKRRSPELTAVSEVYRTLAGMLAAVGRPWVEGARQELTNALNSGYETMLALRSRSSGRDPQYRRLMALLIEATPAIEASLLLVRESKPLPREIPRTVSAIADAILHEREPPQLPDIERYERELAEPGVVSGVQALHAGLQPATSLLAGKEARERVAPGTPGPGERLRNVWERATSGPETLQWAARFALCMAIAEALPFVVAIDRSYWVALTVAVVLKPDFGSVFARALQRGIGTVLGVGLGAVVIATVPIDPLRLIAVAAFATLLPIMIRRNFALFSASVTPVIILLIGQVSGGDWEIVFARLVDTLIGCAIVLLAGYLLWPGTSQPRIGHHFAATVDDVSGYLRHAVGRDPKGRQLRRRRTYRALSDLRTVFQQALTEPPPASRRAAAWWPAIVALERVTDAVTAVAVRTDGGPAATPEGADQLARAMDDLADAVRTGRTPASLPLPDEQALIGVTAEVRTARSVFTGPRVEG